MASERKTTRRTSKRSASPGDAEPISAAVPDWSDDHGFICPNEISKQAIGPLFCLTSKRLISASFTTLYQRSLKTTWLDLLNRERRNLKSNNHSVKKCFMLNRLITECARNQYQFAKQTGEMYEEIRIGLSSEVPAAWSVHDFFEHVRLQQLLLRQRRLFYVGYNEFRRPKSLLTLQRLASQFCTQLLYCYQMNPTAETYEHLRQLLQHCFLIVGQPSIPECVAAAKYERFEDVHTAKLSSWLVCLLDTETIENCVHLSDVALTLLPFERSLDADGEPQVALQWCKKHVNDANREVKTVSYVRVESIQSKKIDSRGARPLYSARLCQLRFQINVQLKGVHMLETFEYVSEPFGFCSHAQYYPENVAKALLHEVTQTTGRTVTPEELVGYVDRYCMRTTGTRMKLHTSNYIARCFREHDEAHRRMSNDITNDRYEDVLTRIVSQMETFIDHPFLSMMYHDGVFLGICDSTLDQHLRGTREEPHILLRYNTLGTHQHTQHASVRFIVHNGQLIRATFHGKAFVDEMFRMIGEANTEKAKSIRLLSDTPDQKFSDFIAYFDEELGRLHPAVSSVQDAYQPLIPVLWNTMRTSVEPAEQPLNSPSVRVESIAFDLSNADISSSNTAHCETTIDSTAFLRQTSTLYPLRTDAVVRHVVERLTHLLTDSSTPVHIAQTAALLSVLTEENIDEQKRLLTCLLQEYYPSQNRVTVSTQTSTTMFDASPTTTDSGE